MTNKEILDEMTEELSDFLAEQTYAEIQAVNDNNFELAQGLKIIIENTLKSCALIYSNYTTQDSKFWFEQFNKQYLNIHKRLYERTN
jgi:hypothetical protein